ncbi:MAG: hypothetical protein JWL71_5285, partial [Acidobacteria bacterium]|nr:hypothetical protein [Acidobacteriota bacterium]
HIQLDRFWFEVGGAKVNQDTSQEEREQVRTYIKQKVAVATETESWVSDGFYSRSVGPEIAQKADIILFIDIPVWRRLLNHLQRIFKPSTRHQELTAWQELSFFYEIIRRTYTNGPKIKSFVETYNHKVTILKSRKEIGDYLQKLH